MDAEIGFTLLAGLALAGVALLAHLLRVRGLRRREEQLRRQVEDLTRDLRAFRERVAAAQAELGHQIRTSLNGVLGMAHLLLEDGLPAEQQEYAEAILRSGRALLSVVDASAALPETPGAAAVAADASGRREDRSLHILVAEDDPVSQQVSRGLMERLGHRVEVAGDGQQALEAAGRAAYDVIFMDCWMPRLDGFAATARLRAGGARTVIVGLTASASPADRERCRAAGMDDVLAKPLDPAGLQSLLQRWSARRAAESPAPVVPAPPDPPVLDEGILEGLRLYGGRTILVDTIDSFLDHAPERIQALGAALSRGDPEEIARLAHSLRGSCGTIGALGIVHACGRIEEAARSGHLAPVAESFADVLRLWPDVVAALQAERARAEAAPEA